MHWLDSFVQFASFNSCNTSQRTQQHFRRLFSTTSAVLDCSFLAGRVFSASHCNLSHSQQNCARLLFPLAHTSTLSHTLVQVSLRLLPHRATTCDVVVSLQRTAVLCTPALIQMKSKGPAHTGRCRLGPHESSSSETKCWRRFFWRWALSPLRFGYFRKFVARSTMMLHGRCIPRHEYPTRQVRDIHTYNRPRLLSEGQAAVWARFNVQNTAPPPRQMRAFTITRLAVHERREWITMSFPVTVYISPGQLSRQNCPATTERV